jgi:hypothetical protein
VGIGTWLHDQHINELKNLHAVRCFLPGSALVFIFGLTLGFNGRKSMFTRGHEGISGGLIMVRILFWFGSRIAF